MNFFSIFITGLFAGGLTCLAVQGGLLASSIAQQEGERLAKKAKQTGHALPILAFLTTRLFAYTFLGFLLGALGAFFQFSLTLQIILQIAVSIFMIGTALNLLQVHPIFRYFVIQPPRALTRLVKNQSKSKTLFGPALLGAFTVLIPCGATQAMMALAVASGSPYLGAIIMFVFILGTSPLFFVLGYTATRLSGSFQKGFNSIAAIIIIGIALFNIVSALQLTGGMYTLANMFTTPTKSVSQTQINQKITVLFTPFGYKLQPENPTVLAGSNVTMDLVNNEAKGCIQAFTIPAVGIQKIIPPGTSETIQFKVPNQKGQLTVMCSMAMFKAYINVN